MSNCCTVLPNQFDTYSDVLSYDTTMSMGSSTPSSGPSTCWKSNTPSPSSSAASHTALVPGALMNARRTPGSPMNRTISAPLLVPRFAVWIDLLGVHVPDGDLVAETGRVDTRRAQRGRTERRADRAFGVRRHGEVVHVGGAGVARIPFRPGTEVVDELARAVVDLDDAAGLGLHRWRPRSSAPGPCRASPSRRGERRTRCRQRGPRSPRSRLIVEPSLPTSKTWIRLENSPGTIRRCWSAE